MTRKQIVLYDLIGDLIDRSLPQFPIIDKNLKFNHQDRSTWSAIIGIARNSENASECPRVSRVVQQLIRAAEINDYIGPHEAYTSMKDCFSSVNGENREFLDGLAETDTCVRLEELLRKLQDACTEVSRVLIFINSQDGAKKLCSYLAALPLIQELKFNPQVVIGENLSLLQSSN